MKYLLQLANDAISEITKSRKVNYHPLDPNNKLSELFQLSLDDAVDFKLSPTAQTFVSDKVSNRTKTSPRKLSRRVNFLFWGNISAECLS